MLVVLVAAVAVPTGVGAGGSAGVDRASTAPELDVPVDPDLVVMRADVREDGTARWTVEYHVTLEDENDTAAFEGVEEKIEENPDRYRGRFAEGMARTVTAAQRETGREMAVRNVTVGTERRQLPQPTGVVVYEFTWTGFAVVDDGTVRVGDAIDRMYVEPDASLRIAPPDGYRPASVTPPADERRERALVWTGPTDFADGEPRVVLEADEGASVLPFSPPALGGAIVLAVALAGFVAVRYGFPATADASSGDGSGPGADGDADASVDPDVGVDLDAGTDPDAEDLPSELLSNEEQVMAALRAEGGRMKQQALADRLDWTDSKTSKVVGQLREDDRIETFRIGRENVVTLPEVSIDDGE